MNNNNFFFIPAEKRRQLKLSFQAQGGNLPLSNSTSATVTNSSAASAPMLYVKNNKIYYLFNSYIWTYIEINIQILALHCRLKFSQSSFKIK